MFDGSVGYIENLQHKVIIFRGQIRAGFGQEGFLEAVGSDKPIRVGYPGASKE